MMKEIPKEARLSKLYTNHCVQATTITVLSNSSVANRHIMAISGHRSETSLQPYNSSPSQSQLRSCSNILANYTLSTSATSPLAWPSGKNPSVSTMPVGRPIQWPGSSQMPMATINMQDLNSTGMISIFQNCSVNNVAINQSH